MAVNASRKRIGIIGGSFNPVHFGHLIVAQDAIEHLELSEVVFMPAAIPPHKQGLIQADSQHRVKMLDLAVESDIRFSVSDDEIQRGGISYTFDTVTELLESQDGVELFLIVGSDTLIDLHNWYKVEGILERCNIATFMRPGLDELDMVMGKVELPQAFREQLRENVFSPHLIEISSSEIRMRVAEGLGIRYLVPSEVEMYIYEHGLYQV